ncbi:MAG: insulinase family protein [Crocinitomicaceae bacterium]|jgi:zinc protease
MKKQAIFVGLLCLNSVAFGQLDRTIMPKSAPAPTINIKESQVFTLPNGVTVVLSENHKTPKVSFLWEMGSNLMLEGNKAGVGNLAGELLKSGTTTRSKDQLDLESDFIGASIGTGYNVISLSCLTKHLDKGLTLMSDVLLNPTFPESEFNRIKEQKLNGIKSDMANPSAMASNAEARANYPNQHPYGEIETENSIKNITRDDVIAFYKKMFTPTGSYLVVVGDITKEQVTNYFNKFFKDFKGGDKSITNYDPGFNHKGNRVLFVSKQNAPQSVITVSFPINIKPGDKNNLALNALNGIFGGGGFGARLTQNLREDKAYTYGCYSNSVVGDAGSYYSISGNFRTEVTDSAIAQILIELKKITSELVTEEELKTIKASMAGSFGRSLESPSTVARFALSTIKYNLPKDHYQNYLKRLDALTKEEILEIAKQYLTAENANIIVVGNPNISEKLKQFDADGIIEKVDALGQPVAEIKKATISKDKLIDRYLLAITGEKDVKKGLKKINKIKTYHQQVTMTTPQIPVDLLVNNYYHKSGKETFTIEIQGNLVEKHVFANNKGYEMNSQTGKSDMTAIEIEAKKKTVSVFPEFILKSNNLNYELIGIDQLNGKEVYVLTYSDGIKKFTNYYDVATFMKVKTIDVEGEKEEVSTFSNFEPVNGIIFPKSMTLAMDGLLLDGKMTAIEVNKPIEAKIFE